MKRLFRCIDYFLINICVYVIGFFIRRDKSVCLFGAWMGNRFADNSRFLYQYLSENKEAFGIKKVIWVTRKHELVTTLRELGYEAYDMYSRESLYWHLKAGVHFVCNMYCNTVNYTGDILGELSMGAKKIQLWHGVGIKACANLIRNNRTKPNSVKGRIRTIIYSDYLLGNVIFSAGGWKNRFHLATSQENKRVAIADYGVNPERIIIANYPRLSDDVCILPEEKKIIEELKEKSIGKKVVLYCPTFRELKQDKSEYMNPVENEEFLSFVEKENFLWVEKKHSASTFMNNVRSSSALFYVDSNFDINLLYQYIDLLITDFSSAASDCIYRGKKVLSFIPDYNQYEEDERGFVAEYNDYYPGEHAYSINELQSLMEKWFNSEYYRKNVESDYEKVKLHLFEDHPCDIGWIFKEIEKKIQH